MAKKKGNDLLPIIAGVFCFFVVFLRLISVMQSFQIQALLLPSLWLVWGLCLITKKKNWLCVVGMLPLAIVIVQGACAPISMASVEAFFQSLLCTVLPAVGFALLWVFFLLSCIPVAGKFRGKLWWLPILLVLPGCVWQSASALPWAEFGAIGCVSLWLKPSGK